MASLEVLWIRDIFVPIRLTNLAPDPAFFECQNYFVQIFSWASYFLKVHQSSKKKVEKKSYYSRNQKSRSFLPFFIVDWRIRIQIRIRPNYGWSESRFGNVQIMTDTDPQHWSLAYLMTMPSNRGIPRGDAQDARASSLPPPPVHPPPFPGHVHPPLPSLEGWLWEKMRQWAKRKKCKFVYLNIIIN